MSDETALAKTEEDSGLPEHLKLRFALPVPHPGKIAVGSMTLFGVGVLGGLLFGGSVAFTFIFLSALFFLSCASAYFFAYIQRKAELLSKANQLDANYTASPSKLTQLEAQEAVLNKLIYGDDLVDARGQNLWGHRPRALPAPDGPPCVVICICPACTRSDPRWTQTPVAEDVCECGRSLDRLRGPVECPECQLAVWIRITGKYAIARSCPRCGCSLRFPAVASSDA